MHDLTALANRLRKVARQRRPWAARLGLEAYRLYDHDIPELRYIVDWYGGAAVVYDRRLASAPDSPEHDDALVRAVQEALALPAADVRLKRRQRIKERAQQYVRAEQGDSAVRTVREGKASYLVNLSDYLDTGLFLDHRPLRLSFQKGEAGARLLNLFAYTGSVSVAAALGGTLVTSVDLSQTYLGWAAANFRESGLAPESHAFVQADANAYLAAGPREGPLFDTVFLDPPTFSNSKRLAAAFSVQDEHVRLITAAYAFLKPGGVLWFSTNFSKFQLDPLLARRYVLTETTAQTVAEDCRGRATHRSYRLVKP